jgi:hypothetical protein
MESTDALKFLLKLLSYPNYRSPLTQFSRIKGRDQICQTLAQSGWIEYSQEIARVALLPAGRSLLDIDPTHLPIAPDDWKVLQKLAAASDPIPPSKLSISKLTPANRQAALVRLGDRGFVHLDWQIQRQKGDVWLTPAGLDYLRDDYLPPAGNKPLLSGDLLKAYLQFLRTPRQTSIRANGTAAPPPALAASPAAAPADAVPSTPCPPATQRFCT